MISYSKVVEEARFFVKVFSEAFELACRDTKVWLLNVWGIITGTAEQTGTCQIKDCDRPSVGTYSNTESWEGDIDVCRKCWVILYGIMYVVIPLFVIGTIIGFIAIVVMNT